MDKMERRKLKAEAGKALKSAAYSPGRLVLIHTAVSSGLALLIALVNLLLDQKIAGTSGLGGMGSRAVLETVQSFLEMANLVLLPFWSIGLVWAFLDMTRGWRVEPRNLMGGFRKIGPVLRAKLLQALMVGGMGFLGCYIGMFVYSVSPLSSGLTTVMEDYINAGVTDYTALMEALMQDRDFISAAMWSLPFMLGGMLLFMLPMYYRIRMMDYVLRDHPEKGAFHAMRTSRFLMRGNCWNLFKLDVSFWWFFLLELLVAALCYGDVILQLLNVDLGVSQTVLFFGFYVLALVAQAGLYAWKRPLLLATYARFYEAVQPPMPEGEE